MAEIDLYANETTREQVEKYLNGKAPIIKATYLGPESRIYKFGEEGEMGTMFMTRVGEGLWRVMGVAITDGETKSDLLKMMNPVPST